ncbi:MAG: Uma2 family endonuclease [Pseudonocardia sp.]
MTVQAAARRITADEFLSHDHPVGSELIDGVVHLNDATFVHQEVCARLLGALRDWALDAAIGRAGFGGNWVLSDHHVYKPDVWWTGTPPRGTRHAGPPELAVEVRSPGTWARDVGPKLREYERSGTTELWLVDPSSCTVLVFRRDGDAGFEMATDVAAGESLTSPLLPGFALSLDDLFAGLE